MPDLPMPKMMRRCVFYKKAAYLVEKRVEWIICRECQRLLTTGFKKRRRR
jgi:hypothetical protein